MDKRPIGYIPGKGNVEKNVIYRFLASRQKSDKEQKI
jgi:hypothetical protein